MIDINGPAGGATAGKTVKITATGVTSDPRSGQVTVTIDGQRVSFRTTYNSATKTLCIEVDTRVGDFELRVGVSDSNGGSDVATIFLG